VVSYSLGMLVTFATVLFSALRVSRLNIVAAVRDLPEPPARPRSLGSRLLAPFRVLADGFGQLRRRRVARALWTWIVGVPRSILGVIWAGFTGGPLTLISGLLLTAAGLQGNSGAFFSIGVSFAILGLGMMLRGVLGSMLKRRRGLVDRA